MSDQPVTTVQIAAFLKRRLRMMRDWPRDRLLPWVHWFQTHDLALVLTDERNRICGVALGRFARSLETVNMAHLSDEPEGRLLWIEAIATTRPEVVPQMLRLLTLKWGDRDLVAGEVFSRDRELRMFPLKTLNRLFGG